MNRYITTQKRLNQSLNNNITQIEYNIINQTLLSNVLHGSNINLKTMIYDKNRTSKTINSIVNEKGQLLLFLSHLNCQDCVRYLSSILDSLSADIQFKTPVYGISYNDCINLYRQLSDSIENVYVLTNQSLKNDIWNLEYPCFAYVDSTGTIVNTFFPMKEYKDVINIQCINTFLLKEHY
jgi:hypothetical protein